MTKSWRIDCIIMGVTERQAEDIFRTLVESVEIEDAKATIVGSVQEYEEAVYVEEDSTSV